MKNKALKIVMSNKDANIKIDRDEVVQVFLAVKDGTPALLKQGMFNPSFFVALVEDKDRDLDFRSERELKNLFEGLDQDQLKLLLESGDK